MDLFEAIAKRCSYRGRFVPERIPREVLTKIVQAGIQAPSACNAQVVSFVIVDDPQQCRRLAEIIDRPVCNEAVAMIACLVDPRPVYHGLAFAAEDCAACVENMLLAITALGYASVWLDGVLRRDDKAARVGRLLGIPEGREVRILLPLGVPAEPAVQKEKLAFAQRAWFDQYGG